MSNTKLISTDYQVTLNDFKILCNNTAGINIFLPKSPILGTTFIIGDVVGTASTNNINIIPSTGLLINGAGSYNLSTDYGQVKIVYDNDNSDLTVFSSGGGGVSNINDGTIEGSTTFWDNTLGKLVENQYLTYDQVNEVVTMNHGIIHKYLHVTADYSPLPNDYGMLVDTTTQAVTIILPAAPTNGTVYFVKDTMGTSPINIITVKGNGKNIDGSGSFVINLPYESYTMIFNTATNQLSLI